MNPQTITLASIRQRTANLLKDLSFCAAAPDHQGSCLIPFYIFHQVVMAASGYFIVQWEVSVPLKVVLLLSICFGSFFLLYRVLIKWRLLPRLFAARKNKALQGGQRNLN